MPDYDAPDLVHFIAAAHKLGLTTSVIAWQDEYNQVPNAPTVTFDHVAHFTVLAYHQASSSILRCWLNGDRAARLTVAEQLRQSGFQVEERTRNEVKYRTGRSPTE
jgi:hypothetical protein